MAWNPTYVRTDTNVKTSPTAESVSKTFNGNITAGNLLFAIGWNHTDIASTSVSDTRGCVWAKLGEAVGIGISIWGAIAASSGACSVTMTWSGSGAAVEELDIFEYTADGVTAIAADAVAGAEGAATSHPAGSVTNTVADVLALYSAGIVGGHDENGGPSGYTKRKGADSFGGSGTVGFHHWSRILSSITTHNPSCTTASIETSDRLVVLIKSGTPPNVAPTANAGPDASVTPCAGSTTLNGTGSTDIDGTIASYAWAIVSQPVGGAASITSPSSASTGVTGLSVLGAYVFELTVTDDGGATDTDQVTITVAAALPIVYAGADATIAHPLNFFISTDATVS